ncbi:hypothetical protein RD110_10355 [Rhodoferax koreense]|uniref:Cellobiose phosphorylase n=1 Tax=Rhodoferax koreensis TaxID=1842727 RepID=A0A1P8K3N2_9BURK|nr:ChbG/HpnK family deacetylase [Rhodoferax koreense]APW40613.1 hypothetical protein RD110_10355 [Rhodoferax koreense]
MPVETQDRPRRICFAADDFGLDDGIGSAVLELVQRGRIQAVGCMVGAPKWAPWQYEARRLPPAEVDVGLHLDLTQHPLLARMRQSLPRWILASHAGLLQRRMLREEIRAQLDAFEAALGRPPAYIDGHQHVHQLPGVRSELLAEIQDRYGNSPPWLRATRPPAGLVPAANGGWAGWAKARVIAALGACGLAAAARRQGIAQNRCLLGAYGFDADREGYLALLSAGLSQAPDAALVMCHPSQFVGGSGADDLDEIEAARLVEFDVLRGAALGRVLADGGFVLQPMSRILRPRPEGIARS